MGNYTIVSFCGGGIRGLLSARILERLAKHRPSILTGTTLFAGTSTGAGIVSFLLANHGPERICDYYLDQERKFFANPKSKHGKEPAYDVVEVAAGVFVVHGLKPLSKFTQQVLFTAFFVGEDGMPWEPRLYSNAPSSTNAETTVVEAVTASSAMPGMLGSWCRQVDGAFVNHDPTIAAIALALSNGARFDDLAVINIGTGLMPDYIASDTGAWGAEQWQNGGPHHNRGNVTPPFLINGTVSPILDMALCGTSANLTPMLAGMMLGKRYVNINPTLDWYIPENATSDRDLDELQRKAATADLHHAKALLEAHWPA
jgi:patatin-like phospholipase/acyl hydrolase